jgi:hypothetical protein
VGVTVAVGEDVNVGELVGVVEGLGEMDGVPVAVARGLGLKVLVMVGVWVGSGGTGVGGRYRGDLGSKELLRYPGESSHNGHSAAFSAAELVRRARHRATIRLGCTQSFDVGALASLLTSSPKLGSLEIAKR